MARGPTDPFQKPFAWSYSKLKNFESCPKRHYHLDLVRDIVEPESDALQWGNHFHDAVANAIGTDDNAKRSPRERLNEAPLPTPLARYHPLVQQFHNARSRGAQVFAEMSLAITRDFQSTEWFAKDAWYRAKVDVLVMTHDFQFAAATDWKTGKRLDDTPQLMLTAMATMIHYPAINAVRTEYVWVKEFSESDPFRCADRKTFAREQIPDIWGNLAPRVKLLERAFVERQYPPKPGALCRRWCPVTVCPYHGA
jgi:hypothetical protein